MCFTISGKYFLLIATVFICSIHAAEEPHNSPRFRLVDQNWRQVTATPGQPADYKEIPLTHLNMMERAIYHRREYVLEKDNLLNIELEELNAVRRNLLQEMLKVIILKHEVKMLEDPMWNILCFCCPYNTDSIIQDLNEREASLTQKASRIEQAIKDKEASAQ